MAELGISTTLQLDFDGAVTKAREALKEQGFGIVTEIDFKATIKEKIDEDIRPYVILGACNPRYAHEAVGVRPDVGLLMPCNVCVWDNGDGSVTVSALNVRAAFAMVAEPALEELAAKVDAGLRAAISALAGL
jgi:uncharacterized protein (DUF302 family)